MPKRSGHARQTKIRTPPIYHQRMQRGKAPKEELPDPASLGLQSRLEVKIYLVLKKHGIPFRKQVNFDGGGMVYGGQRADFLLLDRPVIIEALGPWHDLPGAQMRDDRKWAARAREGLNVVTLRESEAATLDACERNLIQKLGTPVV